MFKKFNILKFGDDIQIHHEKCIEISTNMPSIGLEVPEIAFKISDFLRKFRHFCMATTWLHAKCSASICLTPNIQIQVYDPFIVLSDINILYVP